MSSRTPAELISNIKEMHGRHVSEIATQDPIYKSHFESNTKISYCDQQRIRLKACRDAQPERNVREYVHNSHMVTIVKDVRLERMNTKDVALRHAEGMSGIPEDLKKQLPQLFEECFPGKDFLTSSQYINFLLDVLSEWRERSPESFRVSQQ
jgi:hypothetical protein